MSPIPSFLESAPQPAIENRLYHGSHVSLWRGAVRLSNVHGWADNPRLALEMNRWKSDFANAEISEDDLYEMMKITDHIKLKELSADIAANGLREPIVLTFDGKLLDGNRRFFAIKFAHDNAKLPALKEEMENIPVFVLTKGATEREITNILVEENFSPSLKREWPDYVKAQHIRQAEEEGFKVSKIAQQFGWSPTKVRDTLKIGEITDAFITYATGDSDMEEGGLGLSELEAERIAADNYQFFNEAKKSFHGALSDNDFANLFYTLIAKGKKDGGFFKRFDEVRCAHDGYKHSIGREILETAAAGGGRDLKALIQMEKSNLQARQSNEGRIEEFVAFLRKLSAEQMRDISDNAFNGLRESLVLVQKLVEAAKNQK